MSSMDEEYLNDVMEGGSPFRCCGRTGYCGLGEKGWPYSGTLPRCGQCPQHKMGVLTFQGRFSKFYPAIMKQNDDGSTMDYLAFEVVLTERDSLFGYVHSNMVQMLLTWRSEVNGQPNDDLEVERTTAVDAGRFGEQLFQFYAHVFMKPAEENGFPKNSINIYAINKIKNYGR